MRWQLKNRQIINFIIRIRTNKHLCNIIRPSNKHLYRIISITYSMQEIPRIKETKICKLFITILSTIPCLLVTRPMTCVCGVSLGSGCGVCSWVCCHGLRCAITWSWYCCLAQIIPFTSWWHWSNTYRTPLSSKLAATRHWFSCR